ncbi:hypothetical protein [Cellulophaga sp. HaHa_2_1]|uniref:hypothetical protein n=1 Tax=Cellulophaga sp. HaHa_2_1 TaxID=2749994 RepID=UPI001C4E72DD|nr:hypothetical protein [Cellulophaga sp. HaHa_2_1]QXP53213.1 hypothetical protein H0I24_04565 [Cellulophaga sp. HaHa_2_1]
MHQSQTSYEPIISLNGQPVERTYTAEIKNVVVKGKKVEHSAIVLFFTLHYLGTTEEGNLKYKSSIQRRLFLDDKNRPVFKPSKAQKIGLSVAKINDELLLEVSKNYQFIGILNPEVVQKKWQSVKNILQNSFTDLQTVIGDFDWQMQTENIQKIYRNDTFYTFFFANFFYQEFDENKSLEHGKILVNGIHNLNIPVLEKQSITKQDTLFQNIEIKTSATLEHTNKLFPTEKINRFIGGLLNSKGSKHDVDFTYQGVYKVQPRIGIINSGELSYSLFIKDVYSKTTTLTFNLEKDE